MKNEEMKKLWGSFALEYYNFSRINPNMCRAGACSIRQAVLQTNGGSKPPLYALIKSVRTIVLNCPSRFDVIQTGDS